ncbi:MAG: hypothetical protein IT428_19895 [Planctomycetaceae bacterium]|nr:hypothetical protein [Planctomycetaceae bacterium]
MEDHQAAATQLSCDRASAALAGTGIPCEFSRTACCLVLTFQFPTTSGVTSTLRLSFPREFLITMPHRPELLDDAIQRAVRAFHAFQETVSHAESSDASREAAAASDESASAVPAFGPEAARIEQYLGVATD